MAPSSTFSTSQWIYDVFLSYSSDTGNNFSDHLYAALDQKGIDTYRDELRREKVQSMSELLKPIEESRICIVVFSKNYASSTRCLNELVKILECREALGQWVLPVFYDVDPSDVRKQTGCVAAAFAKHEQSFKGELLGKAKGWRAALNAAANLSGWDLPRVDNGHQSKCIQKIIELIMSKLIETSLDVATYQVGIDTRAEEVNKLLSVQSNDVRIVGICGIGGIGKTTIAKAVYNLIFHKFEGSSFISNIREASKQPNGLAQLQEQLLYDVLKKDIRISSVSRGINLLKERLPSKRVLLVLDDVDQSDQLNALARRLDWFGLGSRIIITTRNEQLLNEFEVRNIYKPKELNHDESIQLFSWHAFGQDHPIDGYMEISKHMVACLGGLPSALEDTGSRLFDRRSMPEWESALMKLKRYPYSYSQRQKLT